MPLEIDTRFKAAIVGKPLWSTASLRVGIQSLSPSSARSMPLAPISIVWSIDPSAGSTFRRSVPRPVIHRLPRAHTIRSGVSCPSLASGVDRFVVRSILLRVVSRWLSTHPVSPSNAIAAGPSPVRTRAMTRAVLGETRTTCAAWSSATQTEPPPIQML